MADDRSQSSALRFEPLAERHARALFDALSDPQIYAYVDERPPASVSALAARYRSLESRRSPDGKERWLNWAVFDDATGYALGFVQATVRGASATIGYVIAPEYWGRGIGTQAVRWLITTLRDGGVAEISARVERENLASLKLLQNLGFAITAQSGTELTLRLP